MASAAVAALAVGALAGESDPFRALRSRKPAERVAALETLLEWPAQDLEKSRARLRPILRKALAKDADGAARGLAAGIYARTEGRKAARELRERVVVERDPSTERVLTLAFAELPPEAAREELLRVLGSDDLRAAALAAEALGRVPHANARPDLLAVLATPRHWAVTAGACLGLGYQRDAAVPAALMPRLRHPDAAVRTAVRESLIRLTGADHGADPTEWEEWWRAVGDGYVLPAAGAAQKKPKPPVEGTTHEAPGDRPTHSRFFGIELRGKQVAFVIDFSQSMWGARRDAAQRELLAAIRELNRGKVKIHAVSLGDEPHELLPELAKQNGGRYVARPFPK